MGMAQSSAQSTVSLSAAPPADDTERGVGVSLDAFPLLRQALENHGAPFRTELLEFAHTVQYQRAPRVKRSLVARVYVDPLVPEVAVVRDLSESGVRLWVGVEAGFEAGRAEPYKLEVKVPGSRRYLSMSARLVRVAREDTRRGIELAFQFTSPLEAQSLNDLIERARGHATA